MGAVPDDIEVIALVDSEGYERSGPTAVGELCSRLDEHVAVAARGAPVTDALKRVRGDGEVIAGSVDRAGLFAPRTPQVLRRAALTDALARGTEPTGDPAAFLARAGMRVEVVPAAELAGLAEPTDPAGPAGPAGTAGPAQPAGHGDGSTPSSHAEDGR